MVLWSPFLTASTKRRSAGAAVTTRTDRNNVADSPAKCPIMLLMLLTVGAVYGAVNKLAMRANSPPKFRG